MIWSREIALRDVNDGYAALKDGSITGSWSLRSDREFSHQRRNDMN
jgi:hypothetical protein